MANKIEIKYGSIKNYFYEEAIKTLRTNIQFSGTGVKVIMLTSSTPSEGKSETSFAIAEAFTKIGKKVLLIDADIRKSVVATRRGVTSSVSGLSQYLSGQKSLEQVICETDIENLDMIIAGPYAPNPAELLDGPELEKLLKMARETYDYVFIDTPPMANLIDGAIVARQSDGAVIVIKHNTVSYRLVQRVKAQIEKSGCRILGTVLTQVNMKEDRYYGKYGKYGSYDKYDKYET